MNSEKEVGDLTEEEVTELLAFLVKEVFESVRNAPSWMLLIEETLDQNP